MDRTTASASLFKRVRLALRRLVGRWLERHDRCCVCWRSLGGRGGMHAFGFWFCPRHTKAKHMGPWSDA